jgi:hypothetical protein
MIPIPSGVRVWIATGHSDMRRGMNSLALLVQEAFKPNPHGGPLRVPWQERQADQDPLARWAGYAAGARPFSLAFTG